MYIYIYVLIHIYILYSLIYKYIYIYIYICVCKRTSTHMYIYNLLVSRDNYIPSWLCPSVSSLHQVPQRNQALRDGRGRRASESVRSIVAASLQCPHRQQTFPFRTVSPRTLCSHKVVFSSLSFHAPSISSRAPPGTILRSTLSMELGARNPRVEKEERVSIDRCSTCRHPNVVFCGTEKENEGVHTCDLQLCAPYVRCSRHERFKNQMSS